LTIGDRRDFRIKMTLLARVPAAPTSPAGVTAIAFTSTCRTDVMMRLPPGGSSTVNGEKNVQQHGLFSVQRAFLPKR
jgi:hypothetical protein